MTRYLTAAALARLADEMIGVAVVLLVLDRTGRPALAGAMVTGYTLPALVSGPLLGAWLDRTEHQRMALATNEGILAVAALGLVATVGRTPAEVPVALAALASVTLPLTGAGFTSMVPRLAAGRLPLANTLDALTFNSGAIAGPAMAGGIAAVRSPAVAMTGVAVTALGGLAATLALPAMPPHGPRPERSSPLEGLRYLVRSAPLRGATLTTVLGFGSFGALTVALPLFTTRLGAGPAAAGLLWTALEAGGVAGIVALARLAPTTRPHGRVLACTALFGVGVATWPLAWSLWAALALVALAGLAEGPILPATFAVRQRYAPPHLLAQLSTTWGSLKLGGYALGATIGGAAATALDPRTMIVLVGVAQLVAAGLGWLTMRSGDLG